jgi:hypothetical protein
VPSGQHNRSSKSQHIGGLWPFIAGPPPARYVLNLGSPIIDVSNNVKVSNRTASALKPKFEALVLRRTFVVASNVFGS